MSNINLNKNLNILLSGQLVSQLGDRFYMLAVATWIVETTRSPSLMGIVIFCTLFPSIVIGFVSGGFIDKYNRKRIIVLTDILRGITILAVTAAFYLHALHLSVVLLAQIILSLIFHLYKHLSLLLCEDLFQVRYVHIRHRRKADSITIQCFSQLNIKVLH